MSLIYAIILFGFLIFIHEFGHFLAAKLSGVRVLKFSIGFGPKIISKRIGETEYLLSAVPLGGYVKMYGEEAGEVIDEKRSFKHQPVYKKIFIVFAGPLFNIIGAIALFWIIFVHGVPVLKPVIGEVIPDSVASKAGLQKGDKIIEIEGQKITNWFEMAQFIQQNPNKLLKFKIERKSEIIEIEITPQAKEAKNLFGEKIVVGQIGIKPDDKAVFIKKEDPITALNKSVEKCYEIVKLTYLTIVKIFQRVVSTDVIGGPILIFQTAGKTAEQGLVSFLSFAAIISINLGVLNLLPIPVLDGGHILFFLIEAVRRKPLSEKFIAVSQKIGIAFLIALMMLAFYNDIIRLLTPGKMP